jgi:hypothetical protein
MQRRPQEQPQLRLLQTTLSMTSAFDEKRSVAKALFDRKRLLIPSALS